MIELATAGLLISLHAVTRWQLRVADIGPAGALSALEEFCRSGRVVKRAPAWMSASGEHKVDGRTRYIVNPAASHIVVVARCHINDDSLTLVTVITQHAPDCSNLHHAPLKEAH